MKIGPVYKSPVAKSIPFDNSTNGFTAENVQTAIEELRAGVVGGPIQSGFTGQGTVSNDWLDIFGDTLVSRDSPYVMPWTAQLIGMAYTNELVRSIKIEIYRAAAGVEPNLGTRIITFDITSARVARSTNFTPITFTAGDKIAVYARANGAGPRNVAVVLYFIVTSQTSATAKETTTTVFVDSTSGGVTVSV